MKGRTHMSIGLALGLVGIKFGLLNLLALGAAHGFLALVTIASLIPDLDHHESTIGRKLPLLSRIMQFTFGHRGVYHGIFGLAITAALFYLFLKLFSVGSWKILVFALCFGFTAHLLADSLTKSGVKWLHPIKGFHIKGPIKTGGLLENIIFVASIFLCGYLISSFGWGVLNYL